MSRANRIEVSDENSNDILRLECRNSKWHRQTYKHTSFPSFCSIFYLLLDSGIVPTP